MKKIYIYADETEQELNGELYLGYGLLFCESRIPDSFISDSISNLLLKHSIEVTKFHACDDNNIIKKSFIEDINQNISGEFSFVYSKKPSDSKLVKKEFNSLFVDAILGMTLEVNHVCVFVEERQGLNKAYLEKILDSLHQHIRCSLYESPAIPSCFNDIQITISNKNEAGIQVVDTLLWMTARKVIRNDNNLFNHLKHNYYSSSSPINGIYRHGFKLGFNVPYRMFNYPTEPDIYINKLDPKNTQEFINIYNWIEHKVYEISSCNYYEPQIIHLSKKLNNIRQQINYEKSNQPKCETIESVCNIFLMIFDTLPIYNAESYSTEDWRIALTSKKMAALILNKHLMNSVLSQRCLHRWKFQHYQQNIIKLTTNSV